MRWRDYVLPLICIGAPFVVLYGVGRLSRWYCGLADPVDDLIAEKGARWRPDSKGGWMDTMDWQKSERVGERRWQEIVRAQRKTRKPRPPKARRTNVIPMAGRGRMR